MAKVSRERQGLLMIRSMQLKVMRARPRVRRKIASSQMREVAFGIGMKMMQIVDGPSMIMMKMMMKCR